MSHSPNRGAERMPPVLAHNPLGAQRAWAARARWGMCYLPGVPGFLGGGGHGKVSGSS